MRMNLQDITDETTEFGKSMNLRKEKGPTKNHCGAESWKMERKNITKHRMVHISYKEKLISGLLSYSILDNGLIDTMN